MTFCIKIAFCLFVAAKHPNRIPKCNVIKNTLVRYFCMYLYLIAYLSSHYEKALNGYTSSFRSCRPSVYHTIGGLVLNFFFNVADLNFLFTSFSCAMLTLFSNKNAFSSERKLLKRFDSSSTSDDAIYEVPLFFHASP